jgi:hypothetical protein
VRPNNLEREVRRTCLHDRKGSAESKHSIGAPIAGIPSKQQYNYGGCQPDYRARSPALPSPHRFRTSVGACAAFRHPTVSYRNCGGFSGGYRTLSSSKTMRSGLPAGNLRARCASLGSLWTNLNRRKRKKTDDMIELVGDSLRREGKRGGRYLVESCARSGGSQILAPAVCNLSCDGRSSACDSTRAIEAATGRRAASARVLETRIIRPPPIASRHQRPSTIEP